MKDSYVEPDKRPGARKPFRVSRAETFFSSLPLAPKDTQTSIAVAMKIVDGAVANLKSAGVHPFGLSVALGLAMLRIAEEENWPAELRDQLLGRQIEEFRPLAK